MSSRRVQSACIALAVLAAPLVFTSHGAAQSRQPPPLQRPLEPGVPQVEPAPFGEDSLPPWVDVGDVPVPAWARSVAPNKADAAFYAEPGKLDTRRGSAQLGARIADSEHNREADRRRTVLGDKGHAGRCHVQRAVHGISGKLRERQPRQAFDEGVVCRATGTHASRGPSQAGHDPRLAHIDGLWATVSRMATSRSLRAPEVQ